MTIELTPLQAEQIVRLLLCIIDAERSFDNMYVAEFTREDIDDAQQLIEEIQQ